MLTRPMLLVVSFLLLGGCSATTPVSIPSTARNSALEPIPAALFKPDGPGPFPAVVIMHDREVIAFFEQHLRQKQD